ncbi:ABC transporter substrate-binding protein [Devosia sp.]|uniref:ABC transporter substrate-binding protein n=1 Tax=Devosia sp. TaxID=1871048 RepID=UPI001B2C972E|nr:ABC transporter substrate-binding protein [Devosia sp.]MBO9588801.1 carbohydrate ABC transporter substrate-binding protein [Devosia sp.]
MTTLRTLRALALAGVVFAIAQGGAMAQTVELNLWSELSAPPESTVLNKVVEMFNAANPDVVVKHTAFENTAYETALRTAFAGGTPPDIAEVNAGSNAFQYAQSGQLLDLTDFVTPIEAKLRPGLETMYRYDGKSYGVLWGLKVGNILYYNPVMLEEQGVDPASLATWEGFMDASQTFLDAGIAPIAFGDRDQWTGNHYFNHILHGVLSKDEYDRIGLQTLDPSVTSDIKWNDEKPVRAWELFKAVADAGYFTSGYLSDDNDTAAGLFFSGRAPFYSTGSWGVGMAKGAGAENVALTLFPPVADSPEPTAIVTNSLLFTIPATTKDADAAKRFLEFLTSEEVQKLYVEENFDLSPYNYDMSSWSMDPMLRQVSDLLENAQNASPFLDMIEDVQCMQENVNEANVAVLTGDLSPQEAGDMHQECVDDLRASRNW